MTSSGCSNMLRERRNCFRGLTIGFEVLRMCAPRGEPFLDEWAAKEIPERGLGGKKAWAGKRGDCLSWVGESAKISESERDEEVVGLVE
jgi:hypothetical protein